VSRISPAGALALGVALALCVLAGFVALAVHQQNVAATNPSSHLYAGTPVDPPKPATDFTLIGNDGRPAQLLAAKTPLEFLFFGYTHCPDECPLAMGSLGRAYRQLSAEDRARTRVVFVTVDPERDTPAVVNAYVRGFDQHFIGLSGSPAQLAPVWRAYGVTVDAKTKEIGHGDAIYAIDGKHETILVYPPDVKASDLRSDATLIDGG
jgi:protein SCO1/2